MKLQDLLQSINNNVPLSAAERTDIMCMLTSYSDDFDRKIWHDCIIGFAKILDSEGLYEENLTFLTSASEIYGKNNPRAYILKQDLLYLLGLFQVRNGKNAEAHKTAKSYLYNYVARLYPYAPNDTTEYFSFRGFSDYSLADIKNETISVAHPREFNDPMDTLLNLWFEQSIKSDKIKEEDKEFRMLLKKASEHLKMRCMIEATYKDDAGNDCERFIEDLDSLMWAHYASSHKGFCVRYKFDKEFFQDYVQDENKPIRLMARMSYNDNLKIDIDSIPQISASILSKSKNWEYEHETRLISYYAPNAVLENDEVIQDPSYPAFKCKDAAKAIYLGVKCSDADRRKMEEAIGDKNIKLYQMCIDDEIVTKLIAKRIG